MIVKFVLLAAIAINLCKADLPGFGEDCVSQCSKDFKCVTGVGGKKTCECPYDTEYKDGACVKLPNFGEPCTLRCKRGPCVESLDSSGKFCCPPFYEYKDGSCQLLSCPEGTKKFYDTYGKRDSCQISDCLDVSPFTKDFLCKDLANGNYTYCFCETGLYMHCSGDGTKQTRRSCESGYFKLPGLDIHENSFLYDPITDSCVTRTQLCPRPYDEFYVGKTA